MKRKLIFIFVFALLLAVGVLSITELAQAVTTAQTTNPTPFLQAPYFDTSRANCVFDHNFPFYTKEFAYGAPVSTTVRHYDGTTATSPLIIGTSSCYSGHSGIDYGLTYEPVLAAADGIARYPVEMLE